MADKPVLGDRPTYRQLQDYLGYLRDEESHPFLKGFDLGQKKSVLTAKLDEIKFKETAITPCPMPIVKACRVCGSPMVESDGWFKCGNCPHKERA